MWQATGAYLSGNQPGDPTTPGASRGTYRNYWNGSWLYWLPAGANPATDLRLLSNSFNRFQAHIQIVPGVRGGVTFPSSTAVAPYRAVDGAAVEYRQFNLCSGSIPQISPSTVFAPTIAPPNAGFYLNQQWVRYEPYLNLTAFNIAGYPGNHTTTGNTSVAPTVTSFFRGYVDGIGGAPTNPPTVYRDNWNDNIGSQGQPIRIQGAGYAGWTDPKADLGGFTFQSLVTKVDNYNYPQNVLTALRGIYGYSPTLPAFTGSTALLQEQFAAWLGNRDGAPAFGNAVGTPAYYDTTAACDPSTGPATLNQCIQFGGSSGTIAQACTGAGTVLQERDASTAIRYTGGACGPNGAPTCSINGGAPTTDLTACTAAGIATPTCVLRADPQDTFYTKFYEANCGFTGQSTVTVATCQWVGRQSLFVEGQGTYFYGGSCMESGSTSSCTAGGTTLSLNGITQSNVVGPFASPPPATGMTTLGCVNNVAAGNYNFGGTCGGGTEYRMPGGPSASLGTPGSPGARTLVGPPAECTGPAGGTSISIRGGATQTYNQTCTNTFGNPGSGTCSIWYGTTCLVSNVPATYCPNVQNSGTTVPGTFYQAYKQQENQANLYHECLADGPTQNPGSSYPTWPI